MTNSASRVSQEDNATDQPIHFAIDRVEVSTDKERREVFHCRFGEWPRPEVTNGAAVSIADYSTASETPERKLALQNARIEISKLMGGQKNLRQLRLSKGLSQIDLADRIGTSQSQIARLEAGQDPTLQTLRKLSDALDVDLNAIGAAFDG